MEINTRTLSAHLHGVSRHTLKQLKFVLPGGLVTYALGTLARLGALLGEDRGWARYVALLPASALARWCTNCGVDFDVEFIFARGAHTSGYHMQLVVCSPTGMT